MKPKNPNDWRCYVCRKERTRFAGAHIVRATNKRVLFCAQCAYRMAKVGMYIEIGAPISKSFAECSFTGRAAITANENRPEKPEPPLLAGILTGQCTDPKCPIHGKAEPPPPVNPAEKPN